MERISRRKFLNLSGVAASSLMILPRHVLGGKKYVAPSDKLNIAGIGVGGQGGGDISRMSSENIVALCDVDWREPREHLKNFSTLRATAISELCWKNRRISMPLS